MQWEFYHHDRQTDRQTVGKFLKLGTIIVVLFLLAGGVYKLYRHEQNQDQLINALDLQVSTLKSTGSGNKFTAKSSSKSYNVLFLGNSITKHPIASYWWNENSGMAASRTSKDYVHRVVQFLKNKKKSINYAAYNYSIWETQAHDRAETYQSIDPYLNQNINLVIIQLGENISNTDTLEQDYEQLIQHVKQQAPHAQVIVVGNFWKNTTVEEDKQRAATLSKASVVSCYVSLKEIQGKKSYQAGMGTKVYADGKTHKINHDGVARHPGDKGMAYIAKKIELKIK